MIFFDVFLFFFARFSKIKHFGNFVQIFLYFFRKTIYFSQNIWYNKGTKVRL